MGIVVGLTFLVAMTIAFAASFTFVTVYIAMCRRTKAKYHFKGTAEVPNLSNTLDKNQKKSAVDSSSAMNDWNSRSGTNQF